MNDNLQVKGLIGTESNEPFKDLAAFANYCYVFIDQKLNKPPKVPKCDHAIRNEARIESLESEVTVLKDCLLHLTGDLTSLQEKFEPMMAEKDQEAEKLKTMIQSEFQGFNRQMTTNHTQLRTDFDESQTNLQETIEALLT
jgi:predicted  nucleic acid-binding Zn-ribbon protein